MGLSDARRANTIFLLFIEMSASGIARPKKKYCLKRYPPVAKSAGAAGGQALSPLSFN